jgi:hypothetical protein
MAKHIAYLKPELLPPASSVQVPVETLSLFSPRSDDADVDSAVRGRAKPPFFYASSGSNGCVSGSSGGSSGSEGSSGVPGSGCGVRGGLSIAGL